MRRWIIPILTLSVLVTGFALLFAGPNAKEVGLLLIMGSLIVPLGLLTIYFFARVDFLFTMVEENYAKIIVRGDTYSHTIISKEGHHVDKLTHGIVPNNPGDKQSWLSKMVGAEWLGWPFIFHVYTYNFRWTTWKLLPNGKYGPVQEDKELDAVLLSDYPFYVEVDGAECKDLIPLTFKLVVTVKSINPYKTVFQSKDWLRQMTSLATAAVVTFSGNQNYQDIIDNEDNRNQCEKKVKTAIKKILLKTYGVEVSLVSVQEINPPDGLVKLTLTGVTARLEAEKIETEAKGQAVAKRIAADATAYETTTVAAAYAKGLIARAEALKKSGDDGKMIVGADMMPKLNESNKIIFTGSLTDTILGLIGGKKP